MLRTTFNNISSSPSLQFAFVAIVCVAIFTTTAQTTDANTPPADCADLCPNNSLINASPNGQCLLRLCTVQGQSVLVTESPNTEGLEIILQGEECLRICREAFSVMQGPPGSDEEVERAFRLDSCPNTCGIVSPILPEVSRYPLERPREDEGGQRAAAPPNPITDDVDQSAATSNAQSRGLCVLKTSLSSGEVESILSRDVGVEVNNTNVEQIVGEDNEDERNLLCLYSSMKLVTRYIFLIVGVTALIMILFAAFLWINSKGDSEKTKVAKRVLVFALIGFAVTLLSQVFILIMQSLL